MKGLIVQIVGLDPDTEEIEMLHRGFDGTPTFFKITTSEVADWRLLGIALIGPKPNNISPESARGTQATPRTATERDTPPSDAAPANPLKLEPLKVEELLEPLPPEVKAVPMNNSAPDKPAATTPLWDMEDQPATPAEKLASRRRMKINARNKRTDPRKTYSATVTNGAGDKARVNYSLRSGLDPARFIVGAVAKARDIIPDVKPFTVSDIKEEL